MKRAILMAAVLGGAVAGCQSDKPVAQLSPKVEALPASSREVPDVGALTPVASFNGPMPTGVTVSRSGRIFVAIPRWGDPAEFTVGELVNGELRAFPNKDINQIPKGGNPAQGISDTTHLISVQSCIVDGNDNLWIADTGSINFQPTAPGGPKMICVDLKTNQITKTVVLPADVALKTSYLNDFRIDLKRGTEGYAYFTDSSDQGPNAIIVVDLATGRGWRKLNGDPSVTHEENFAPTVEGQPLMAREPFRSPAYTKIGCDGIALSPDGKTLYWSAWSGRHLYSISTDLLADPGISEQQAAAGVNNLGDKGFASDGLESDRVGNVYLTDYENQAVRIRDPQGRTRILVQDSRLIFPDTLSVAADGNLYIMSNQLSRAKKYQGGFDKRKQPFGVLFRTPAYAPDGRISRAE